MTDDESSPEPPGGCTREGLRAWATSLAPQVRSAAGSIIATQYPDDHVFREICIERVSEGVLAIKWHTLRDFVQCRMEERGEALTYEENEDLRALLIAHSGWESYMRHAQDTDKSVPQ